MGKRQKEPIIITGLLLALGAQVALLLWHMDILPGFTSHADTSKKVRAGHVVQLEKKLKRRSPHSLVWESSQNQQEFYYHDSLLTLSESQAVIELANQTRLKIGENTLIAIEPLESGEQQDIKIRFQRGRLASRNPYGEATIEEGDLELRVEKNSEIEIHKGENSQAEIDVKKGSVRVKTPKKQWTLEQDQWLSLNDPEAGPKKISTELSWVDPPLHRHYIRDPELETLLKWTGDAYNLSLKKTQGPTKNLSLKPKQKEQRLSLEPGEYQLRLLGKNQVSEALWLQVRQAPTLHLLKPEPRNRLRFGVENFIWTPLAEAQSYRLVLKGKQGVLKSQSASDNSVEMSFQDEGDFHWEVWGLDTEGIEIPPAYDYPLFIRENPLEAPKLKKPLRLPASPEPPPTSWLDWLIPKAWAQTQGALLSWDAVPGADHYVLEVAANKNFRQLVLSEKLTDTQYVFVNLDKEDTLYWRVAAGSKEQLGMFSDSENLNWQNLEELPTDVKSNHNIRAKAKPLKEKDKLSKEKKTLQPKEKLTVSEKNSEKITEPLNWHQRLRAFWAPSYIQRDLRGPEPTQANTLGEELLSFAFQWDLNLTQERELQIHTHISQGTYSPSAIPQRPFQDDVTAQSASLRLLTRNKSSAWLWGISAAQLPHVERNGPESVELRNHLSYGLQTGLQWQVQSLEYMGLFGLSHSAIGANANTLHRLSLSLSKTVVVGLEYEGFVFSDTLLGSSSHQGRLLLGFEF